MKNIIPAERTANVTYAIRDLAVAAARYESAGDRIDYLNIGDPAAFGFRPPKHLIDPVVDAIRDGKNHYVDSMGIREAREAIAKESSGRGIKADADRVIVTAGGSEAIDLALSALVNPGESILTPMPGYPLYNTVVRKLGANAVGYRTDEANGWQPDIEDIKRKIDPNTRGIIINNPNNPTGAVYSADTLREIAGLAGENDMVVFADEVYDRLLFDGAEHVPVASVAEGAPVVTFSGLSKNGWFVPGWRVGWMTFSDSGQTDDYREAVAKLARARICAPGPFQYAIKPALEGPQDHMQETMRKLAERRDLFHDRINTMRGFSCVKPSGAFYAFPKFELPGVTDDEKLVLDLLDKTHMLAVHGRGFDYDRPDHFRVVLLPEPEVLNRTLDRLDEYSRQLYA